MADLKQRLLKLLRNTNFIRAAIIYGVSLLIGVVGFFVFGGTAGWYFITCSPGFGTGIALALLNNGHKQHVTLKSSAQTIVTTLLLAVVVYVLSDGEIIPVFLGLGLSIFGNALGLWFCQLEAGRNSSDSSSPIDVDTREIIDIFDKDMNKIGEMEKVEAHEKHQWHKNSHIWVTDGKNVLVQLRASDKKTFPNKWDISAAGHFCSGDTPLECAKREWEEELGLPWEFGDVKEDFMRAWGIWEGMPVYEFVYFFFFKGKPDISKAKLQKEEVAAVKWMPFDEFKEKIKTDDFCPFGDEYWNLVIKGLGKFID